MNVTLSEKLLNQIGEYLASRPYREVALLLSSLAEEINAQSKAGAEPQDQLK